MQALIVCDKPGCFPQALSARVPTCLLPVGNRPLLFHMLEYLSASKIRRVTLAVSNQAGYVGTMLDDGKRFGVELNYLPVRDNQDLGRILRLISPPQAEDLLVLPGLVLTDAPMADLLATRSAPGASTALYWAGENGAPDAELLLLGASDLAGLARGADAPEHLLERLAKTRTFGPSQGLLVWDMESWWTANVRFLEKKPPFADDSSAMRGHNCRIHPRALLQEPVCLGQDVVVGAGCRIGPLAVIGDNCIVDDGVEISNAAVLPGTFAGLNTTLDRNLACQDLLVSLDDATCLHVPDPFILGAASAVSFAALASDLTQRALAALLLLLALPALGAMALRGLARPSLWRKRTLAVSWGLATLDGQWTPHMETLHGFDSASPLLSRLPALWDVVRGVINLVGVEPLAPDRTEKLSGCFAESRFFCRAGLFCPWDAQDGPEPDDLERRVMEVYYCQTRSFSEDMRLALRSLARLFRSPFGTKNQAS
ncbi:hypothetical protein JCM15519_06370 [Fundidesulfovibrio butyratiphilus]